MERKDTRHGPALGVLLLGIGSVACRSAEPAKPDLPKPELQGAVTAGAIAAPSVPAEQARINPRLLRRFAPLAATPAATSPAEQAKVALGRMLFFEPRLSLREDLSCNSCHRLDSYGVDRQPTSLGAGGQRGTRNSPTVYHAAGHFTQFWDGRAADVEEQAKGPILNPKEMAMPDAKAVVARLRQIPGYLEAFARAFPGKAEALTYDHVGVAIGAFERGLVTPARWDEYLRGDETALSSAELEGLKVFTDVGCMVCHTGTLLGGSSYQRTGAVQPWQDQSDQGRFEVTNDPGDKMMFKVPTLRNVAETGPYFHDGSVATLPEAVGVMAKHQLGLELEPAEVQAIVTWLKSLTGKLPSDYIAQPELPARAGGKDPT